MKIEKLAFCTILVFCFVNGITYAQTPIQRVDKISSKANTVEFRFDKNLIKMNLSFNDTPSAIIGVENSSDGMKQLKISTPQFKAQPVSDIPVQLISNFKGLEAIKGDTKTLSYNKVKISEEKMPSGQLYQWNTPTKGSAFYFYFQNSKNKTLALKIGPVAESLNIKFDWGGIVWEDLSSGH
jgi:hypothetical protein